MRELADRVLRDGQPYTAGQIRLVAFDRNDSTGVADWPKGVPVPPPVSQDATTRMIDLDGEVAATLVKAVPQAEQSVGQWPVLRTSDGLVLGVAWRYLLPDEPD
jgi:hypothetical protein